MQLTKQELIAELSPVAKQTLKRKGAKRAVRWMGYSIERYEKEISELQVKKAHYTQNKRIKDTQSKIELNEGILKGLYEMQDKLKILQGLDM